MGKGAAHVATRVTVLQTAEQHLIEGSAGNHAQLALRGYGIGKRPVGDAHAHAALNDDW